MTNDHERAQAWFRWAQSLTFRIPGRSAKKPRWLKGRLSQRLSFTPDGLNRAALFEGTDRVVGVVSGFADGVFLGFGYPWKSVWTWSLGESQLVADSSDYPARIEAWLLALPPFAGLVAGVPHDAPVPPSYVDPGDAYLAKRRRLLALDFGVPSADPASDLPTQPGRIIDF